MSRVVNRVERIVVYLDGSSCGHDHRDRLLLLEKACFYNDI